jgi:hypothetical protein
MGFRLEWATNPWGQNRSHPHCVVLNMGCGDCWIALPDRARTYMRYFAKP